MTVANIGTLGLEILQLLKSESPKWRTAIEISEELTGSPHSGQENAISDPESVRALLRRLSQNLAYLEARRKTHTTGKGVSIQTVLEFRITPEGSTFLKEFQE